jgi:hypothetical protein
MWKRNFLKHWATKIGKITICPPYWNHEMWFQLLYSKVHSDFLSLFLSSLLSYLNLSSLHSLPNSHQPFKPSPAAVASLSLFAKWFNSPTLGPLFAVCKHCSHHLVPLTNFISLTWYFIVKVQEHTQQTEPDNKGCSPHALDMLHYTICYCNGLIVFSP